MSKIETTSNSQNSNRWLADLVSNIGTLSFKNCFGFRISSFEFRAEAAFTLIELLVVIALIIILAGLILSTIGYVQNKGARSRAETEIAAISAALENYKADNGIYPRDNPGNKYTDTLDARVHFHAAPKCHDPEYYAAGVYLFTQLSGTDVNQVTAPGAKTYFTFKPQMLGTSSGAVLYLRDPFGESYGYSTAYLADSTKGFNPTFDLWSTAGTDSCGSTPAPGTTPQNLWIKNW
jgi:type II secretory pathway pseudopilin PulG